jgi:hypothetical protein
LRAVAKKVKNQVTDWKEIFVKLLYNKRFRAGRCGLSGRAFA